jgi:[ribosomal protein S18]-alanine N-acetyltransferase
MKFTLRRAKSADIENIMRVEDSCFDPPIRERRDIFLERIETFPEGFLLLVSGTQEIAGYLCAEIWASKPEQDSSLWLLGHSPKAAHNAGGKALYVSSFAVDPAFRGNGGGRFLFDKSIELLLAAFPAIRSVTFLVSESWTAARAIYETEGFAYTGKIAKFFGSDDALIMERES